MSTKTLMYFHGCAWAQQLKNTSPGHAGQQPQLGRAGLWGAKALLGKGLRALGLMWGLGQVQGGLRVDMNRQAWESLLAMAVPKSFGCTGVNACITTSIRPVYVYAGVHLYLSRSDHVWFLNASPLHKDGICCGFGKSWNSGHNYEGFDNCHNTIPWGEKKIKKK